MKKNLPLYIMLVFLIVVNGFFMYRCMGDTPNKKPRKQQKTSDFIIEELGFSYEQLEQFKVSNQDHNTVMRQLSEDIRDLKDELFNKLSNKSVDEKLIDSLTSLLGKKEKEKRTNVFYHFKEIQNICDSKQKEKFEKIIKEALHDGGKNNSPPSILEENKTDKKPPPKI